MHITVSDGCFLSNFPFTDHQVKWLQKWIQTTHAKLVVRRKMEVNCRRRLQLILQESSFMFYLELDLPGIIVKHQSVDLGALPVFLSDARKESGGRRFCNGNHNGVLLHGIRYISTGGSVGRHQTELTIALVVRFVAFHLAFSRSALRVVLSHIRNVSSVSAQDTACSLNMRSGLP